MNDTETSLCNYQAIADVTERMLAYARAGQWEQVSALTHEYREAVRALQDAPPLSRDELASRRSLMLNILENDAGLRRLISPQLETLSEKMGNLQRQRNVLQAYYAPLG